MMPAKQCGLFIAMLLLAAAAAAQENTTNSRPEVFRTVFDRERQLRIGYSIDAIRSGGLFHAGYERVRAAREGEHWRHRYSLLHAEVSAARANRADFPHVDVVLFSQESMYYVRNPHLTLPTRPPRRLRIPFNFGLQYSLLGFRIPETTGVPRYDLDIASGRVVLDWIPSPDFTTLLQLNFGILTRGQFYEKNSGMTDLFVLAPFTAFGARLRLAAATGRRSIDIRWDCIPAWTSREQWKTEMEASLLYRMILFAVNDQPVFLRLASSWRRRGYSVLADRDPVEWTLGAGLEVSIQLL